MSWKSPRMLELEEQRYRASTIRFRIERHYGRMRSFSRVAREALADRDVRAALAHAGLPVPAKITFDETVVRMASLVRRDKSWLKGMEPRLRAAVLVRLAE